MKETWFYFWHSGITPHLHQPVALLTHRSYVFIALTHRFMVDFILLEYSGLSTRKIDVWNHYECYENSQLLSVNSFLLFTFSVPEEFNYDPVSRSYGEPQRRPEIRSSTIEFIAPSEYMVSSCHSCVFGDAMPVSNIRHQNWYKFLCC